MLFLLSMNILLALTFIYLNFVLETKTPFAFDRGNKNKPMWTKEIIDSFEICSHVLARYKNLISQKLNFLWKENEVEKNY